MSRELPAPQYDMTTRQVTGIMDVFQLLERIGLMEGESIRRVAAKAVSETLTEFSRTQRNGHESLIESTALLDAGTLESAQAIIGRSVEATKGTSHTQRNRYLDILAIPVIESDN